MIPKFIAEMTTADKIALFNALGAWAAAFATVAAVVISLWIALRSERVHLRILCGLRLMFMGDGTPGIEHVYINVTNHGPRPVRINLVGWAVGRRRKRRHAVIPHFGAYSARLPVDLVHGESASFMVSLEERPDWFDDFNLLHSPHDIETLVAQVHTSVGKTVEVRPEKELLDRMEVARFARVMRDG